ncbi:MAG TPA: error-prone DNA polymerase, partial [Bacillota bacterium]
SYPDPRLEPVLGKTYGVILYQEQVIQVATIIAGFSAGEADELRRVMTHARSHREMQGIGRRFVEKAVARGVRPEVAETIFRCIQGYASYGFSEGHAAAFARHAYLTAYLLEHFPAPYYAALLSHQPLGYYPPRTLAYEARRRGIRFLPPDVNASETAFTVEAPDRIRIGLGAVKGLGRGAAAVVEERRRRGPYRDLIDFAQRLYGALDWEATARLVRCGALDPLTPNRRAALWKLRQLWQAAPKGTVAMPFSPPERLPDFDATQKHRDELELLGLDAHRGHLFAPLRPRLRAAGIRSIAEAQRLPAGERLRVAGLVIRPHRPPTKSGRLVTYFTLEDETGLLDVTVFEEVYRRDGAWLFSESVPPLIVEGTIDFTRGPAVVAARLKPLTM